MKGDSQDRRRKPPGSKRQESELRYRTIFEQSPDGIAIIDPATTRLVEFNEAAHRQLGYSRDEFARLRISDLDASETPEETRSRIEKLLREGKDNFEALHRTKQGEIRNVLATVRTLRLDGRDALQCVFHDITERKQAEKAYQELAAIVENSEDAIISMTLDGRITSWNRGAEQIYGYTAEEATGQSILITVPSDRRHEVMKNFEKLKQGEKVEHFETVRVRKDGGQISVAITVSPIKDARGDTTRASIIVRNITQHKQAEAQVGQLLRQNTLLLESIGEGVFGVDARGDITFINPAALRMLGCDAADLIGRCSHTTFHHTRTDGTPYPRDECPIYASFHDGAVHCVDSEVFWRKNGSSFPVEYHSTPIRDKHGDLIGAVATFRDITERRALEARFLRAQRMESIGLLAGGIAH
ncbi:MAG: PAS domain S-box protein, partial [Verrucomicrobia bacterium]|nr:PAS domain S-box protein [Verrucomicrobiota bacterium]